jgi:spore maturation protein CgeB
VRVLIITSDYKEFLSQHYAAHSELAFASYDDQLKARNDTLFGMADFYSRNLRACGCEAMEVHVNNEFMQKAWAREQGLDVGPSPPPPYGAGGRKGRLKRLFGGRPAHYLRSMLSRGRNNNSGGPLWLFETLAAQIRHYKPDVILNHDMYTIGGRFLEEAASDARLIVGQIASPLPNNEEYSAYDLIVSSLPNLVSHFRGLGLKCVANSLAFEHTVLDRLPDEEPTIPVVFVGTLSKHHASRTALLEHLCNHVDIEIWGEGVKDLPNDSSVRSRYKGPSWGIDMYRLLRKSRIAINQHIDIAGNYANNCRLYEATGVGTMLITDRKSNLSDIFEPGKEVAAYGNHEECVELIEHFLRNEEDRVSIARAGRERTLRDHTYRDKMLELKVLFENYL